MKLDPTFRRFALPSKLCSNQHRASGFIGIAPERGGNSPAIEQNASQTVLHLGGQRAAPIPNPDGVTMCEKCEEIDKTIARYQRILLLIGDQVTVDRTKELIADLEARKAALHPEPSQ